MGAKPRVESQERSFLKGLVGKRLEEMVSSTPPVDPLELLGLTSSAPSPSQVLSASDSTSTLIEESPQAAPLSESLPLVSSTSHMEAAKSKSTIQSVCAESVVGHTDSVVADLVPTDRIQTEHSPHDSLYKDLSLIHI